MREPEPGTLLDSQGNVVSTGPPQIDPKNAYVTTEGGVTVPMSVIEDRVPFKVGEKVPFKGFWFKVIEIGPGSITLKVEGQTGQYKRSGKVKGKKGRGTNMTPKKKRRKK